MVHCTPSKILLTDVSGTIIEYPLMRIDTACYKIIYYFMKGSCS